MSNAVIKTSGQRILFTPKNGTEESYPLEALKKMRVEDGKLHLKFVTTTSESFIIPLDELIIGDAPDPITDEADARTALNALFPNAGAAAIPTLEQVLTESNDAGGLIISSLGVPNIDSDAATKQYVDEKPPNLYLLPTYASAEAAVLGGLGVGDAYVEYTQPEANANATGTIKVIKQIAM